MSASPPVRRSHQLFNIVQLGGRIQVEQESDSQMVLSSGLDQTWLKSCMSLYDEYSHEVQARQDFP